jgi:hypothetical protein
VIRAAVAALVAVAALAIGAAPGQAAGECDGLMVCIPVAGPWVKIPAPTGILSVATWQLTCPQGVVGGTDAQASEPAVGVDFPGRLGSPVNPGITTTGTLLFRASYAGRLRHATSFRPFIGCIPKPGGGTRTRTGYERVATPPVKPGNPLALRVKVLLVRPGALARASLVCLPGERLISSTHSVGIYTTAPPTPAQLAAVHVVRATRDGRVLVSATRQGLPDSVRVEVQIQATCGP